MDISGKDNVYFSVCSGYNYYIKSEGGFTPAWDRVGEIIDKDREMPVHDVVNHVLSGEEYYLTDVPPAVSKHINVEEWISIIRNQPKNEIFIWPIDIIMRKQKTEEVYSLVFQKKGNVTTKLNNLIDFLDSDEYKNLPDERKNVLIMNFLDACINFYSLGYAYHEFNRNRIFVKTDTLEVFFEFSFSIHKTTGLHDVRQFRSINFLPEYNDLWYYYPERKEPLNISDPLSSHLDLASDYFCIAIILFKMIVGVLPYEGRNISHMTRNFAHEIEAWQQKYISYPVFIFDANDDSNRLSIATYTDVYEHRWDELPPNVRNMFHNVFQKPNALRSTNQLCFYPPERWKKVLSGEGGNVPLVYRM